MRAVIFSAALLLTGLSSAQSLNNPVLLPENTSVEGMWYTHGDNLTFFKSDVASARGMAKALLTEVDGTISAPDMEKTVEGRLELTWILSTGDVLVVSQTKEEATVTYVEK